MGNKNIQSKGVYIGIVDTDKAIVMDSDITNHNAISLGNLGEGKVIYIDKAAGE